MLCFSRKGQVLLEKRVQNLLARYSRKPLQRRDIADMLNLHGGERKNLTAVLRKLVATGVIKQKKGFYRLPQRETFQGVFSKTEQGYGFVRPEVEGKEDLFISARNANRAMNGDTVTAEVKGFDRSGRPYGCIAKVLQRARKIILGIYREQKGRSWVVPLDAAVGTAVFVSPSGNVLAKPGQLVKLEFSRYPDINTTGSGKIIEVLGDPDEPQVDIEAVIFEHALPRHFSAAVLTEAEQAAGEIRAEDLCQRTDLRALPLMTIDGETAKDFDDAVAVREESQGIRLWVAIADVAHYVAAGSVLDSEARERGTSVYFPGFCLPMLPEALSNGICSLNPNEDRLTLTAELLIGDDGCCCEANFYPAVIRSRARLTYSGVAAFLHDAAVTMPSEIAEQLPVMAELAEQLGRMRRQRGSLELDVPDVQIVLDDSGFPTAVARTERTIAHRLIEEFMLAANEAVAAFLEGAERKFLYRIHEPPTLEKLQDFQQLAAESGVGLVLGGNLQRGLQQLLEQIVDKPEARLLNQQLLRSLQQARYSPENTGHFGLAAECYCHFTSPIRRYPDLIVHRVLKALLRQEQQPPRLSLALLTELGRDCSDRERRAMAAERQLFEMRRCQLLQHKLGECFTGIIVSVTEFGFFVELDELLIEGLVHVRSLQGDFYSYDPVSHILRGERRRKEFRVGMSVKIRVEQVDVWRRRIDFTLAAP